MSCKRPLIELNGPLVNTLEYEWGNLTCSPSFPDCCCGLFTPVIPEQCPTKAPAPQKLSQWQQSPPSHPSRPQPTPAYGCCSKMSHRRCLKWHLLSKWCHHNISVYRWHRRCRSCPRWHTTFPALPGAAPQEMSTVETPFLPQPTVSMRTCPQWRLLSCFRLHLS